MAVQVERNRSLGEEALRDPTRQARRIGLIRIIPCAGLVRAVTRLTPVRRAHLLSGGAVLQGFCYMRAVDVFRLLKICQRTSHLQ
jgi:hypothetical protein